MKILHVSLWPIYKKSIGGTEKYVMLLSSALKKLSIENDVVMLSGKKISIDNVSYIPLNLSSTKKFDEYSIKNEFFQKFTIKSLQKFAEKIENEFDFYKYDIIHFNSLLFYFCCLSKKRIFTMHDDPACFNLNWGRRSFNKISRVIKSDKNSKTVFVAPSKYYAAKYRKKFNKKIFIIPHSLDKSLYTNRQKTNRKELNIFVPSRLEIKQKGQDLLLKSLIAINKKLPKFRIIFAGLDDQYKPNVKALQKIKGSKNVSFIFKKINNMETAYQNADLVVLPSRFESFGYSALESLALGKKTVLSNIPTYNEIATGNKYAFIVPNAGASSLGKTILEAVKSDLKTPVSKKWLDRYSPDQWINKYVKLYKLCLNK